MTNPNLVARTARSRRPLERLARPGSPELAIDVGRVEQGDAEVERAVNQRDRRVVVFHAARVDIGDPDAHAAESQRRDCRSLGAESLCFHGPPTDAVARDVKSSMLPMPSPIVVAPTWIGRLLVTAALPAQRTAGPGIPRVQRTSSNPDGVTHPVGLAFRREGSVHCMTAGLAHFVLCSTQF